MKGSGYFAPLVTLPIVVTEPGTYRTRCGEEVIVSTVSTQHTFGCYGVYKSSGIDESWHKSGRVLASRETDNDIVARAGA